MILSAYHLRGDFAIPVASGRALGGAVVGRCDHFAIVFEEDGGVAKGHGVVRRTEQAAVVRAGAVPSDGPARPGRTKPLTQAADRVTGQTDAQFSPPDKS